MSTELSEAIAAMILERRKVRTAEYEARQSSATNFRETFKRRRAAGLRRRHAEKLARLRAADGTAG